jgi:tRNA U34 5-carboxymethylaminomethyl modifying GTPase MnmE/TrmE
VAVSIGTKGAGVRKAMPAAEIGDQMTQNEYVLDSVLERCSQAAQKGYDEAAKHTKYLKDTLERARNEVKSALKDFEKSSIYDSGVTEVLGGQLKDIQSRFSRLSDSFDSGLRKLRENLSKFSITLFGRTMAGKSTLMEILKQGDGSSIGKGAQRTTRDVRQYQWNGLEITDVPGIGAFKGQEDEAIAFEAARKADLILFLLTDDAPQAAEAECFARIIKLGKPVICIMNVKAAVSEHDDPELALWYIRDRFNQKRLDTIKGEFLSYARKVGQDWTRVPFVYAHLKSAFLAQRQSLKMAGEFYAASNIDELKKQIISTVRNKGEFYRIRTFIDAVAVPALDAEEALLCQYVSDNDQGQILKSKRNKLAEWKETFRRDGISRIKSEISSIRSSLNSEVASFAEDHFDDEHADRAWNRVFDNLHVKEKCEDVLKQLGEDVNNKIKEISRELSKELSFVSQIDDDLSVRMPGITDGKRIWNWTTGILSGGLSIAAGISLLLGSALTGPIGWVAFGVGVFGMLFSFIFDSREEKEHRARVALEKKLKDSISQTCEKLEEQMLKAFADFVDKGIIEKTLAEMDRIGSAVSRLCETLAVLARAINGRLLDLNKELVSEAIRLTGKEGLESWIHEAARLPGDTVLLNMNEGKTFAEESRKELCALMQENVKSITCNEDDLQGIISGIMGRGIAPSNVYIDKQNFAALVPFDTADPDMISRARLAQQLARLVIKNGTHVNAPDNADLHRQPAITRGTPDNSQGLSTLMSAINGLFK